LHWKDAGVKAVICHCRDVTKYDILMAIDDGARSLDDIRARISACTGDPGRTLNPSGECCWDEVQEMLDYYSPFADALRRRKK
jgi:NAD(P)H-nitrite reductase large subunit